MTPSKPRFVGERVKLGDICRPKQWKSLKQSEMTDKGYPVYGANGIIGFYSEYNHENETILVGCRGTCGEVTVCKPKSYVTSNAMCLDDLSDCYDIGFIVSFLKAYDFRKVIGGTSQPQITKAGISSIEVPVFSIEDQRLIARRFKAVLDEITRCEGLLMRIDQLVKSRFVEMFGAYEPNCSIDDACVVLSGFAFKSARYVDDGIRIMRIANVQKGYIEDKMPCYYPEADQNAAANYALREDDLLVSLTGNVGRVGLVTKELLPAALNQRVACLRPKSSNKLNTRYLFALLNLDEFEKAAIEASSGSAQKNLSIKWLKSHRIAIPPIEIQSAFDAFCKQVDKPRFVRVGVCFAAAHSILRFCGHTWGSVAKDACVEKVNSRRGCCVV